ncbi:MAG: hypothetical protein ACE5F5_08905 [Acidimicrobiia bacterium]
MSLSQLIERSPDLGPVIAGLESQLGVSIAIYDLTRPDPERPEAHLCRRVQPAVLTGRALERLRTVEGAAVEQVALVAYARSLQLRMVGGA